MTGPVVQLDPQAAGGLETFTQSSALAAVGMKTKAAASPAAARDFLSMATPSIAVLDTTRPDLTAGIPSGESPANK
jgi:hypothetical protein